MKEFIERFPDAAKTNLRKMHGEMLEKCSEHDWVQKVGAADFYALIRVEEA